jgi:hypothetical protein
LTGGFKGKEVSEEFSVNKAQLYLKLNGNFTQTANNPNLTEGDQSISSNRKSPNFFLDSHRKSEFRKQKKYTQDESILENIKEDENEASSPYNNRN